MLYSVLQTADTHMEGVLLASLLSGAVRRDEPSKEQLKAAKGIRSIFEHLCAGDDTLDKAEIRMQVEYLARQLAAAMSRDSEFVAIDNALLREVRDTLVANGFAVYQKKRDGSETRVSESRIFLRNVDVDAYIAENANRFAEYVRFRPEPMVAPSDEANTKKQKRASASSESDDEQQQQEEDVSDRPTKKAKAD
jgi:hypothetical protein